MAVIQGRRDAIRSLFVSLPIYPIFWCLFSSLVQRRWKSDVFQPESNDIFTDRQRLDVKCANKQRKVQIGRRVDPMRSFPLDVQHSCCLLILKCEQTTKNINFTTFSQASWVGTDEENTQTSANGSQTVPEGSCAADLYFPHSAESMFGSWRQTQRVSSCVKHAVVS